MHNTFCIINTNLWLGLKNENDSVSNVSTKKGYFHSYLMTDIGTIYQGAKTYTEYLILVKIELTDKHTCKCTAHGICKTGSSCKLNLISA